MKRAALFLALMVLVLPLLGADCNNGAGTFMFTVIGPELHDNLWQFAAIRGWKAAASITSYAGGHNHARLVWGGSHYAVADTSCAYGLSAPDGTTLVIVAEYTADANTTAQRGYIAAASFVATDPIVIADATMREVPPVVAVVDAGTVQAVWTPLPTQTQIVGYRLVRSADGLASWTTVTDVAADVGTANDTPASGTYYYAVQVIYQNDGINKQVSPHGASWQVVVP